MCPFLCPALTPSNGRWLHAFSSEHSKCIFIQALSEVLRKCIKRELLEKSMMSKTFELSEKKWEREYVGWIGCRYSLNNANSWKNTVGIKHTVWISFYSLKLLQLPLSEAFKVKIQNIQRTLLEMLNDNETNRFHKFLLQFITSYHHHQYNI